MFFKFIIYYQFNCDIDFLSRDMEIWFSNGDVQIVVFGLLVR